MDLNLQITNTTKLLIGILGVVLIILIATQWGPDMYKLVSNRDFETKQTNLQSTKDLVMASELLKPIQTGLYQKVGLADNSEGTNIFTVDFPNTVVRKTINGILREAGIPRNYQLNIEPVPGKKSESLTTQAKRNLIVLLYQNKLESEREVLSSELEDTTADEIADDTFSEEDMISEEDMMDTLMNAWLGEDDLEEAEDTEDTEDTAHPDEADPDVQDEDHDGQDNVEQEGNEEEGNEDEGDESTHTLDTAEKEQVASEVQEDDPANWEFDSLPESIPSSIRIDIIELLLTKIDQHLVGADTKLFENEYVKHETVATPGFFGIGAKKATVTYNFRPNSDILLKFTNLMDNDVVELNSDQLTSDLLVYLEKIQSQITDLTQKLQLAPTSYSPDSYTIKVKFKTELDKLVKLNRLIETKTKWLMVRDLKVSADKDNKINVDVLMIARVYQ